MIKKFFSKTPIQALLLMFAYLGFGFATVLILNGLYNIVIFFLGASSIKIQIIIAALILLVLTYVVAYMDIKWFKGE